MDAEHRHELKTNELADWLTHAPQYFRDNARTIIGLVLIIIAVITWPLFKRMRTKADLRQKAQTTDMITEAERTKLLVLQTQMEGGGPLEALVMSAHPPPPNWLQQVVVAVVSGKTPIVRSGTPGFRLRELVKE